MRLLSLRLKNYLGIANGLLRDEITIDFTRCRNRIILIKGATGSGKTTILEAISPLPDNNSILVPGMQAEKELIYDNGIRILIIHPIANNGERATNKAYIWEGDVNLNPNGNITSFKEIVSDRFGIDDNFEALSKLSTRDRGIADKTPAIRKKYMSSIISEVDVYNNMNKTLSKNSNALKSLMRSMTAKIDSIGDEKSLDMNIKALDSLLAEYKTKRDKLLMDQASALAIINTIDPDGAIMNKHNSLNDKIKTANVIIKSCQARIVKLSSDLGLTDVTPITVNQHLIDWNDQLIKFTSERDVLKSEISNLITRADAENSELNNKITKLNMLISSTNYDTLIENINNVSNEIVEIEQFFKSIGITNTTCTTAQYNAAINIIDEIQNKISSIFDLHRDELMSINIDNNSLEDNVITDQATAQISNDIDSIAERINQITVDLAVAKSNRDIYAILNQRPKNCNIDSCPFIENAVSIKEDPDITISRLNSELTQLNNQLQDAITTRTSWSKRNICIRALIDLSKFITSNNELLKCIPNSASIFNVNMIIYNMLSKNSPMAVMPIDSDMLHDLSNKAYMFDSYKALVSERDKLITQKSIFDSKAEVIDEINSDIEKIRSRLSGIEDKMNSNRSVLDNVEQTIKSLTNKISICTELNQTFTELNNTTKELDSCQQDMLNAANDLNKLNEANTVLNTVSAELNSVKNMIEPTEADLTKLKFSKQKLVEYQSDMAIYKANYDKTETIKAYTSPTDKGIQLIFMEMYMHKIIAMANDLLAKLFGGQFMLQPFIITGDEFRIPCIGNRMMNDDISSMSMGQICMISMVLSFSILFNSASNYNILRLDEIDGGLDMENRIQFINTLTDVMNILGCEQCFLISHNEEIQYSATDMILLRTNSDNHDYGQANIIFDINRD